MQLYWNEKELTFEPIELSFKDEITTNHFARLKPKSLAATIAKDRYNHLEPIVIGKYDKYLEWNIGEFLFYLKENGDNFYTRFLNQYGDLKFGTFRIEDKNYMNKKGLYAYRVDDEIKYIGRCLDNFQKRVNNGYGRISPKNCYLDGRNTNCRMNNLIMDNMKQIKFYVCLMDNVEEIKEAEIYFIRQINPSWNIQKY
ncbi:hypothetical protein AJ85_18540 [Alkalihalobacillus alcalophilus ATCC 27647 = CGMCC 1.3604]|uniref:GIY-YIG domain-containing protein n=1 Tax=Alkalihalobacillus alcalophilus ATCC 27647 = CGMCC 1.3604 TaxID=1218173 RepID=A0A4S4JVV0_ALKAL|nr:hypothetical protein [Alkalihalobacillus alcalophilus]MED1561454.1 hypothetical protein [Alkalihalobacillus alcalophilus]THG89298.1 hypothetical protein AJ85_18540 [Alkalihalobacillus alcalophilus ATCC 27647 = CGMCC 1.3604]